MAVEKMDVEAVVDGLNRALALQRRSVLLYSLAASATTGPLAAGIADRLHEFARAELDDVGKLVGKLVALDGDPSVDVAPLSWEKDPGAMIERVIEAEAEALDALQALIEPAGDEAEGEAMEHLLEHAILRKQTQVDFLKRVSRGL